MKSTAHRIESFKESIFATMSKLALEHQALNLSQGFPDFEGPEWVRKIASDKVLNGNNQYAPYPGSVNLRKALQGLYKKNYHLDYDWNSEISISVGATEAIYSIISAVVNPGDEVILFEPFYDSYYASVIMAGGIVKPVTLHAPDFSFDPKELEEAVSNKTKLIIVNSPHNPTGKMFSKKECEFISKLAVANDLYVLSDEVYEYLTFDEFVHTPMAQYEGMKDRTFTVSSAGKTLGLTGWKIGWVCTSSELTIKFRMVRQFTSFSVATAFQEAVAEAILQFDKYIPEFKKQYLEKRDYFYQGLIELGFTPNKPQGTYFIMCPISNKTSLNDVDYAMELITKKKVAAIPPSVFYSKSEQGKKYLRFCFAKKEETLRGALFNLKNL
jgi:N-succinyldiaminopimelate aminotransferase